MAELPEELGIEVEALEHLYGHNAFIISSQGSFTTLSMPLLPRQLDGEHEAYVAAKLVLKIDNSSYPTTAATAILDEAKGLTDAACTQLQAALRAEAVNLAGEMVLGHLCELALDLLTEANLPSGSCIFCLEDLLGSSQCSPTSSSAATAIDSKSGSSYHVLKLPCFHCFHIPCFTAWFQWQQAAVAAAAAAEPSGLPGQRDPLLSAQDVVCEYGWVAKNVYTIKCPSCRLEVPPIALRHALPQLLAANKNPENQQTAQSPPPTTTNVLKNNNPIDFWSAEHPKPKDVLSAESLHQLLETQRTFKRVLDLQRACGGLVQENVAVSVAELEAAAAEKRQQQQQAQAQQRKQQGELNNFEQEKQKSSASGPNKSASHRGGRRGSGGGRGGKGATGRGQDHQRGGGGRGRGVGGSGNGRGRGGQPRPANPPPANPSS